MEGSEHSYIDMAPDDFQFVKGCLLGDGCITKSYVETWKDNRYYYPRLKITHGIAQRDYLTWKANRLNKIFMRSTEVRETRKQDNREGFKDFHGCSYVFSSKELQPFADLFYQNDRKVLSKEILSGLGLRELAIYFMDDGSFGRYAEGRQHTSPSTGKTKAYAYVVPRVSLSTHNLTDSELSLFENWVTELTGCKVVRSKSKKENQLALKVSTTDAVKFIDLIKPFAAPGMSYKFDQELKNPASPWVKYLKDDK